MGQSDLSQYDVPRIGHSLITMIEPHPGEEYAYNRWYEDDHFYAAMCCPWMFAGKRWVATRELQGLRMPAKSNLAEPLGKGCYLTVYWIAADHFDEYSNWPSRAANKFKRGDRRTHLFVKRDLVFTAFQEYIGPVYRDKTGPRDIHALDYPWSGLVLEVVESPNAESRPKLEQWLREEHLPKSLNGSPAAMCLLFRTHPEPDLSTPKRAEDKELLTPSMETTRHDRRVTLLWFLEKDPRECWSSHFQSEKDRIADGHLGHMDFCAPFIPTFQGTDRYLDELR